MEPCRSIEISIETHQPLALHKSCGREMGIGAEPRGPVPRAHQHLEHRLGDQLGD